MDSGSARLLRITTRRTPICSRKVVVSGLIGLSATTAACVYSIFRIRESEQDFRRIQRAQVLATGAQVMNGIQRQLETSVSSTKALSAVIQLDDGRQLFDPLYAEVGWLRQQAEALAGLQNPSESDLAKAKVAKQAAADKLIRNASSIAFNAVAESLIETYKGITNLQLAPAGVVSVIHPLRGNEGAIGHDLFYDPKRRVDAVKAIEEASIVFAGPITLIQNGQRAILARNPVFISRPGFVGPIAQYPSWWGFTTMLCLLGDLFKSTPLANARDYQISYVLVAMKGGIPNFLHASEDVAFSVVDIDKTLGDLLKFAELKDPVKVEFRLPELAVHWVLHLWPRDAWLPHSQTFVLQVLLCTFFTVCSCISLYSILVRESVIAQVSAMVEVEKSACILNDGGPAVAWSQVVPLPPSETPHTLR